MEPTAMPAIKLYIYNFLVKNYEATKEDLEKTFIKINRLSELENEYSKENNLLPTIGVEIEVPRKNLTYAKREILTKLEIPNESEENGLWEVNPSFSYSPWVQARIIQELAEMEALPLENKTKNSQGKIVGKDLLSLHVNFGMPAEVTRRIMSDNRDEIVLMSDTLTYAFSSTDRIAGRKTATSVRWDDDAKESKKSINKKKKAKYLSNTDDLLRLELRAGEFRDYPTYRMLAEAQRLIALLISNIKENSDLFPITPKESTLVELWKKFENEVKILFQRFNLENEMIDSRHGKTKIIEILNETDLRQQCRKIVTKYSKEVTKVLKLADETDFA
jgi:hypothetical protein